MSSSPSTLATVSTLLFFASLFGLFAFGVGTGAMHYIQQEIAYLEENGVEVVAQVVGRERVESERMRRETRDDIPESQRWAYYIFMEFNHPSRGDVKHRHLVSSLDFQRYATASPSSPVPLEIMVDRNNATRLMFVERMGRGRTNYAVPIFGTLAGLSAFGTLLFGSLKLLLGRKREDDVALEG